MFVLIHSMACPQTTQRHVLDVGEQADCWITTKSGFLLGKSRLPATAAPTHPPQPLHTSPAPGWIPWPREHMPADATVQNESQIPSPTSTCTVLPTRQSLGHANLGGHECTSVCLRPQHGARVSHKPNENLLLPKGIMAVLPPYVGEKTK